jgi:hypothetical protein
MRRKNAMLWRQARLIHDNARRQTVSRDALRQRRVKETKSAQKAFQLRCDNEETLLLRKVYQALLKEALRLQNEEKKQGKAYTLLKQKELEQQLQSLQSIFRERLAIVQEQEQVGPPSSKQFM